MIRGYIGLAGQGKTFSMVADAVEQMKKGRRVISNIPIKFRYWKKEYQSIYISGNQFMEYFLKENNALFLFDEASLLLPNYFWQNMPMELVFKLGQNRKFGLDIYYTSQGYSHTVRRLRDLSNEIVKCRKVNLFGKPTFINIYYDPEYFEHSTLNVDQEKKFIIKRKVINIFDTAWLFKAYDSMYIVDTAGLSKFDRSSVGLQEGQNKVLDKVVS